MTKTPIHLAFSSIDDLVRLRAAEEEQPFILGCSKSERTVSEYEKYTARELDEFIGAATHALVAQGLEVQGNEPQVASVLGPSNLSLLMTICGLSRLGYTVLVFSPRLSPVAYASLLQRTGSGILVHTPEYAELIEQIRKEQEDSKALKSLLMITHSQLEMEGREKSQTVYKVKGSPRSDRIAFIMHSSGSTGTPKPIYYTHKRCLEAFRNGFDYPTFVTLPLFHAYGFSAFYRALEGRMLMYLFNSNLPVTVENVVGALEATQPRIVSTVPYTLKIMAESSRGVEALARCEMVTYHGSACPDELGDRLTRQGVHIVGHIGSTEAGALATTARPREDDSWNYFRFLPTVKPHIQWKPVGSGISELVLLEGLKTKVMSNSDNPPNSFHTRDLWTPHPTIPEAWKFAGRLDDRVTLVNGEKVLPLPMEGRIRQDPLVKEVAVFGIGRTAPGLLVFPSILAKGLSPEDFLDRIWPSIQDANKNAEDFSQISRDMIVPMDIDTDYPRTDKGTIMRARVYDVFSTVIDEAYNRVDNTIEGSLRLDGAELETYLLDACNEKFELKLKTVEDDFFAAGLDSLRAMQLATYLRRNLYLGGYGKQLTQNLIYESGTVALLAQFLYQLQSGIQTENRSTSSTTANLKAMADLVKKYSQFTQPLITKLPLLPRRSALVLTGATGTLGAHLLAQLISLPYVTRVFCLVRHSDNDDAFSRIQQSLNDKGLGWALAYQSKIVALDSDLSQPDLGLSDIQLDDIKLNAHTFLHCAWSVNFNLGIRSFESHIKGVWNLINLSLSTPFGPASLYFCSSVSVASRTPAPATIPEEIINDFSHSQSFGYGQSKLVAEQIISNSRAQGSHASVLRIGQIVGDSIHGLWNDSEAIPLMIRSAITLGALPSLAEPHSWFPVDYLAKTILELASISETKTIDWTRNDIPRVYNLVNPTRLIWNTDVLPALSAAGLSFEVVSPQEWLKKLRSGNQDPKLNPTVKLADFYERRYAGVQPGQWPADLRFATDKATRDSQIMSDLPNLIQQGIVGRFVQAWLAKWKA